MRAQKLFGIAEMIALGIAIAGLSLRLLEINGSDMLLLIGMLFLAFLYLLLGVLTSDETQKYFPVPLEEKLTQVRRITLIAGGIGLSVIITGILFRLLHWSGWQMQLMVGMGGCAISILLAFFTLRIAEKKTYQFITIRLLVALGMSLMLFRSSI